MERFQNPGGRAVPSGDSPLPSQLLPGSVAASARALKRHDALGPRLADLSEQAAAARRPRWVGKASPSCADELLARAERVARAHRAGDEATGRKARDFHIAHLVVRTASGEWITAQRRTPSALRFISSSGFCRSEALVRPRSDTPRSSGLDLVDEK